MQTTTATIKPASLGTVISHTLRLQDLLPAFATELEYHINRNGDFFCLPENFALRDRLNNLHGDALDCFAENGEDIRDDKEDEAAELMDKIQEALSAHFSKPYCFFGAHYGDGSDFGFWPDQDVIEELPTVADSDEAEALGEDCKTVNDHGNVTVWSGGKAVLELV